MKKIVLSFGLLIFLGLAVSSCKKSSDEEEKECPITVQSIAGKYKLVAAKYVVGTTETDALHNLYDDCELDDINELKADGTFIYTDAGTTCSPSGSTGGTWNIAGMQLLLNAGVSTIESFNCTDLVVTYASGSDIIRETYRKQ